MKRIIPDYITKIEGHGTLRISFKEERAELWIEEGERLFEGILLERSAKEAPFITSRICGICPTAHNLASLKAIEDGLGIEPDGIVIKFRKLLLSGQIIFSHILHLFFLVLPDFWPARDPSQLARKYPAEFHLALNLKRLSDQILSVVGGRPIHPTLTTLGGFLRWPEKGELVSLVREIEDVTDEAKDLVKIFANLKYPKIIRETEYLSIEEGEDYPLYHGRIVSNKNSSFLPSEYKKEISEKIKPYSTAKFGRRNKRSFRVGAQARVSLFYQRLNPIAQKALLESKITFPSFNPFDNNFAQAVEILHFLEEAIKIIYQLLEMKWPKKSFSSFAPKPKTGRWGIGVVEAPRGTLYHAYQIDKEGKIKNADILTPTVQNLSNLEDDAKILLEKTVSLPKEERKRLLEMLVRSYDPCITCAVH